MKITALLLPLVFACTLVAQEKQYVDVPGAPTPGNPIWAIQSGNNAIFNIGKSNITLSNLEFTKPFFGGEWKITYTLRNNLDRELEDVMIQYYFYSKDGELLNDFLKAPGQTIDLVPTIISKSWTVAIARDLWPSRYKEVDGIKALLVSFKAPKTTYERIIEEQNQRQIQREAERAEREKKYQAERAEAEAKREAARKLREAEEEIEMAKQKKAAAIAKKKRDEAIARQPAEAQEMIRKRQIRIGMTKEQVILAWGRPSDINTTTYAHGSHEQWVYSMKSYVYFEGGRVTTIQN